MKTILMLASTASMIDQFNKHNIELLQEKGYSVKVACNFLQGNSTSAKRVSDFQDELKNQQISYFQLDIPRKITDIKNMVHAAQQLRMVLQQEHFDLIHCHSPIGSVICRLVCVPYRKHGLRVMYTAHGFHFYKGAPLLNWLVYFPVEWICSFFTDAIITINKADYAFALRHLKSKKTYYIPGVGIDVSLYQAPSDSDKIQKEKLSLLNSSFVILSVGELNNNKNHRVIIQALNYLNDPEIHYIIAGKGNLKNELIEYARSLGIENQVHLLGYCSNIQELLNMADIFAFPSKREGLGLAAIEAMASGKPLLTSDSGGIKDYSVNGITGFCCKYSDAVSFVKYIHIFKNDPKLRNTMGQYNAKACRQYDYHNINNKMRRIYTEMLE